MGTDDLFKKRRKKRMERKAGVLLPKADSYLIVTEGKRTEPLYFKALANKVQTARGGTIDVPNISPQIEVEGRGMNTVSLVQEAARISEASGKYYKNIWVVFDRDDFRDFDEAIRLAKTFDFNVAWSNQAFELWLCLHFAYLEVALSRDQLCDWLSNVFRIRGIRAGGYEKNLENLYDIVTNNGNQRFAIKNAEKLRKIYSEAYGVNSNKEEWDPCTTVDLLVADLVSYLPG